ncbi:MAG: S8 family peptidase [Ferruginibacter sp.]
MAQFPHLTLKQKLDGRYQFAGRRIEKTVDPQTQANLDNRQSHAAQLSSSTDVLLRDHFNLVAQRKEQGLPQIFDSSIVPLFLQVDPKDFDIESLKGFGIEIVSEEEDGFIIGASSDNFTSLAAKIEKFINEDGKYKDQAAKLWQIIQGSQWRVDHILSPELREKYILGIDDSDQFIVDISIACYVKLPDRPVQVEAESDEDYQVAKLRDGKKSGFKIGNTDFRKQKVAETDEHFTGRLNRWRKTFETSEIERDEIAGSRQMELTNFIVKTYQGEILGSFIDLQDSFGFRAQVSGQALKDLIVTYPFVFEVSESEQIDADPTVSELADDGDIEILVPSVDSPTVCVIDSGMQEQHILLAPAVLPQYSKNYVPYENTMYDQVINGGHGTKVAGAILFGNSIPINGQYQPPCFLINAKVLDRDNLLPSALYPPELMIKIVTDFKDIRVFNMSIASWGPCRVTHMSAWAATIDKLIHENKILFLLACGNIKRTTGRLDKPGVAEHLLQGRGYPNYLFESSSRISNPAQSMLALTVGSVCVNEFQDADRISFGKRGYASSFSRSGPGMWGCVKPDVVEYAGDYLREKNGFLITEHDTISAHLVKTGSNRTGYAVGTSFATPKVGHIIAQLANKFPTDSTLLYKALVIQSARLPEHVFFNPSSETLRLLGYGIPDANRALANTPYRITFVAEGTVAAQQANLYSVNIPQALARAGNDFDILVEVTLTYTAAPRRTRKKLKSYFGSWLSWESSKIGESFQIFSGRVLKNLDQPDEDLLDTDVKSIRWSISTSPNWGFINDFKRQDSATQKDWVILKSNILPEEFSFAVVGHKGWDKDTVQELPFALAISFEAINKEMEIYDMIDISNRIEVDQAIVVPVETNN